MLLIFSYGLHKELSSTDSWNEPQGFALERVSRVAKQEIFKALILSQIIHGTLEFWVSYAVKNTSRQEEKN